MNFPLDLLTKVFEKRNIFKGIEVELMKNLIKFYNNNKNEDTKKVINQILLTIKYDNFALDDINMEDLNDFESVKTEIKKFRDSKTMKIREIDCDDEMKNVLLKYYFKLENINGIEGIIIYLINRKRFR